MWELLPLGVARATAFGIAGRLSHRAQYVFEIPIHVARELGGYTVPVFLHCLAGLSSCSVRLKMITFAGHLLFWGSMGLQKCQGSSSCCTRAGHVLPDAQHSCPQSPPCWFLFLRRVESVTPTLIPAPGSCGIGAFLLC